MAHKTRRKPAPYEQRTRATTTLERATHIDLSDGKYEPDQSQAGVAVGKDGRRYKITNRQIKRVDGKRLETLQLERESPKVRGKAARKAEKRARQRARDREEDRNVLAMNAAVETLEQRRKGE